MLFLILEHMHRCQEEYCGTQFTHPVDYDSLRSEKLNVHCNDLAPLSHNSIQSNTETMVKGADHVGMEEQPAHGGGAGAPPFDADPTPPQYSESDGEGSSFLTTTQNDQTDFRKTETCCPEYVDNQAANFCSHCGAQLPLDGVAGYEYSVYDPAAGRNGDHAVKNHADVGVLFIMVNKWNSFDGKAVPKKLSCTNILSGSEINLTRARFIYPKTVVTAVSILAGAKIVVPRGVNVVVKGVGILGGFKDCEDTAASNQQMKAPVIEIQGVSILGGVDIKIDHNCPPIRAISE